VDDDAVEMKEGNAMVGMIVWTRRKYADRGREIC
jgi:hypothetical protein